MTFDQLWLPIICLLGGGYFFVRNVRMLLDEGELKAYLMTSPKGKLWASKHGMEKTVSLSKKYFLPLGCVMSSVLFGVGLVNIILLM